MSFHGKGADGLNDLTRKFLENYKNVNFDPAKRKEALIQSGYSETTASKQGYAIERSIKPHILRAMRKAKIGPQRLTQKLSDLLECPGEPTIQLRALDMGLRLIDAYPNPKITSQRLEHRQVTADLDTLRVAEEVTGERIIDALPEHYEDEDDSLGPI
jgi:hypothetical protein